MVGLGDTTRKLQKLADTAEKLFERMNELRQQVQEMRERVNATHEEVERLGAEQSEQRALIEALAEAQGIDVEQVLTEVAIEEAEPAIEEAESPADTGNASE